MDIKDFILIGGGILIAMVVGHGFWIAWRAKREPLRMDIVPDLIPDDVDEIERLRGELPNGGARIVNRRREQPSQENLDLGEPAPTLMDPVAGAAAAAAGEAVSPKGRPRVRQEPPRFAHSDLVAARMSAIIQRLVQERLAGAAQRQVSRHEP